MCVASHRTVSRCVVSRRAARQAPDITGGGGGARSRELHNVTGHGPLTGCKLNLVDGTALAFADTGAITTLTTTTTTTTAAAATTTAAAAAATGDKGKRTTATTTVPAVGTSTLSWADADHPLALFTYQVPLPKLCMKWNDETPACSVQTLVITDRTG